MKNKFIGIIDDNANLPTENITKKYLKYCSAQIQANPHTTKEVVAFITDTYNTTKMSDDDYRLKHYCTRYMDISKKLYPSDIIAFIIDTSDFKESKPNERNKSAELCVFINIKDVRFTCTGFGARELMHSIIYFKGVSHKDIAEQNDQFQLYVQVLVDKAELLSLEHYMQQNP